MKTLLHNGHKIEVPCWGTKKVFYDGNLMSSSDSVFGATLSFQVIENNETAIYEVKISELPFSDSPFSRFLGKFKIRIFHPFIISPRVEIRRNGALLYSDRQTVKND
jgi:hypothetical protein